ncbi:uncharacterized protein [Clytia hemisphaerica]
MNTTTVENEEREAVIGHFRLKSLILGLINLYVSESGFIKFESTNNLGRWDLKVPTTEIFIAGYVPYDGSFATQGSDSAIWFREEDTEATLSQVDKDIKSRYPQTTFKAKKAVVITFYNMTNRYITFRKNTFQVVIGHDSRSAYLIMNYDRLDDTGARAGYNLKYKCNYEMFAPIITSHRLKDGSNIGKKGRYVYWMNDAQNCRKSVFYTMNQTIMQTLPKGDDIEKEFTLSKPMPLWNGVHQKIVVSVDGRMTSKKHGGYKTFDLRKMEDDVILVLNLDYDSNKTKDGNVYFAEQNDADTLQKASQDISFFTWKPFNATQVLIVYWRQLRSDFNEKTLKFQGVLASDSEETYLIHLNEKYLGEKVVQSGVSAKRCFWNWFGGKEWVGGMRSNTGYNGQNIYKVSNKKCFNDYLVPFGEGIDTGDMGEADEVIKNFDLTQKFPFFSYEDMYIKVNTNNALTKKADIYSFYGPNVFNKMSRSFISLFYNDMFTEFGGHMTWRETKTETDLSSINNYIKKRNPSLTFIPKHAIVLTLVNVQQYGVRSSRNTMQQILVTDGSLTFAILNVYQADSVHMSASGYYDENCKKAKVFHSHSEKDFEEHLDEINPIVVKLINKDCTFPEDDTIGVFIPTTTTTSTTTTSTTTTTTPTTTTTTTQSLSQSSDTQGTDYTVIIGSGVGGGVFLILIVIIACVCKRR